LEIRVVDLVISQAYNKRVRPREKTHQHIGAQGIERGISMVGGEGILLKCAGFREGARRNQGDPDQPRLGLDQLDQIHIVVFFSQFGPVSQ